MAVTRDILETVWVLRGTGQGVSELGRMAQATQVYGQEVQAGFGKTSAFGQALDALGNPLQAVLLLTGLVTGGLAAMTAELGAAAKQFAEDERDIFRASIVLQNMKSSLPIEELQSFSQELQKSIAIDDEAVVALGGLLSRFNFTGQQIKSAIGPIIDASKATGRSIDDIGTAIGRALQTGRTQGLVGLSDQFKRTGDQAKDLTFILDQLNKRFAGAAEAERGTLAGSATALSESFKNFQSAIGQQLAPAVEGGQNLLTQLLDTLTEEFPSFIRALQNATPFGAQADPGNPAARIGRGGGSVATEETLQQVAANTKMTHEALVRALVGGGPIGTASLNIRALNQAIRSAR